MAGAHVAIRVCQQRQAGYQGVCTSSQCAAIATAGSVGIAVVQGENVAVYAAQDAPRGATATRGVVRIWSDLGKLAKPSYQTVLERVFEIRNQSSPVLRMSHSSVW